MTEYSETNGTDIAENGADHLNISHENLIIENQNSIQQEYNSELQQQVPSEDDTARKLFVGGLSWDTTEKDLREYFVKFGDIDELNLKIDSLTQRSRCFAFIQFKEKESVQKILCQTHELQGRTIDPKPARIRGTRDPILKVFVGGMNPETTEETIRSHFEKYGRVTEIDLPVDRNTGMRRGFCFVGFETEEIVDIVAEHAKQEVGGKKCDVKKAIPAEEKEKNQMYYPGGYDPSRGRGRGRGRGAPYGPPPPNYNYNYQQPWGQPQGYYDYYGNWVNYDYSQQGGYDYSQYPGYDYSSYYNQQGWGQYPGYEQSYYSQPQVPPQGQSQPPAQQPYPPQQQQQQQQQPYPSQPNYAPQQPYPPQQQQPPAYPTQQQSYSSQPPSYAATQQPPHEAPGKDSGATSNSSYHPYART